MQTGFLVMEIKYIFFAWWMGWISLVTLFNIPYYIHRNLHYMVSDYLIQSQ